MELNRIIIFIMLLYITTPALGETGTITISDDYLKTYNVASSTIGAFPNWDSLYIDTGNYNYINYVQIDSPNKVFAHDFESTSFSIIHNGTGTGYFCYDAYIGNITYVFSPDSIITGSPITLSFTNNLIQSNITSNAGNNDNSNDISVSANYPVKVRSSCCGYNKTVPGVYTSGVSVRGDDDWGVTYPTPGYFQFYVNKNVYVNSKYFIKTYNQDHVYSQETTFNKNNISGALIPYTEGLTFTTTLASGLYVNTYINSTIAAAQPASGTIAFNKSGYNLYEALNISYSLTNADFSNNLYFLKLRNARTNEIVWEQPLYSSSYTYIYGTGNNGILSTATNSNDQADYYHAQLIEYIPTQNVQQDGSFEYILGFNTYDSAYYGNIVDITQGIKGNFTIQNAPVAQGSDLIVKYNLTGSGKLRLGETSTGNYYDYTAPIATNTNYSIYIPETFKTGSNYIELSYISPFTNTRIVLQKSPFSVTPLLGIPVLYSGQANYNQGNIIKFTAYTNQTGYVKIVNPSGSIIFNHSLTVTGDNYIANYQSSTSDEIGTYTAYLVGTSGILKTATTYLNYGMQTPTPTPTVIGNVTSTPVTLIDITSNISEQVLGKLDSNSDGLNSNEELSGFGNKILSTLILIVLVLLIAGIFSRKR